MGIANRMSTRPVISAIRQPTFWHPEQYVPLPHIYSLTYESTSPRLILQDLENLLQEELIKEIERILHRRIEILLSSIWNPILYSRVSQFSLREKKINRASSQSHSCQFAIMEVSSTFKPTLFLILILRIHSTTTIERVTFRKRGG